MNFELIFWVIIITSLVISFIRLKMKKNMGGYVKITLLGLLTAVCFFPARMYFFAKAMLHPTGFWQNLILGGIFYYLGAAAQLLLLVVFIIGVIVIIKKVHW